MKDSFQDMIAFGFSDTESEPAAPLDPAELVQLLEDYAAALRREDEAKVNELRQPVEDAVAGGATRRLEKRVERLQTNIRELYGENRQLREEAENPTFLRMVSAAAADLGLSFGWGGVYFTLFLAWWRGRTPGKWFFGLRVVRLDDRPLTLFGSFERFAGYAAGLTTGLLGFLQILWDPNRPARRA